MKVGCCPTATTLHLPPTCIAAAQPFLPRSPSSSRCGNLGLQAAFASNNKLACCNALVKNNVLPQVNPKLASVVSGLQTCWPRPTTFSRSALCCIGRHASCVAHAARPCLPMPANPTVPRPPRTLCHFPDWLCLREPGRLPGWLLGPEPAGQAALLRALPQHLHHLRHPGDPGAPGGTGRGTRGPDSQVWCDLTLTSLGAHSVVLTLGKTRKRTESRPDTHCVCLFACPVLLSSGLRPQLLPLPSCALQVYQTAIGCCNNIAVFAGANANKVINVTAGLCMTLSAETLNISSVLSVEAGLGEPEDGE